MRIDSIEEMPKGRRRICLDTGEKLVLYSNELSKLRILEDKELDEKVYSTIMKDILPRRAKLRGLNLLKSRPYTEWQLRNKYVEGGYPESVIEQAIEYLKGYHYIDDYEYCHTYITYKSLSRSRRRIVNDLLQKGISKDVIYSAMNSLEEMGDLTDESDIIGKLLEKKHYNSECASYEDRQKMMSYLYSKGFNMDTIISSLG